MAGTVAVLGPGGVGGLLAGLLARAGERVVALAGDATAAVLRDRGLAVDSASFGAFHVAVGAATALRAPVDAVLVAVKATQLEAALARLPAEVVGRALVVPFLNGVDHVGVLRGRYPDAQVVAATIRVESTRTAPGVVAHASPFAGVELAGPGPDVDGLADRLRAAGLDVAVRDDEARMLWGKLAFLAPFALVTTAAAVPIGTARTEHRADLAAAVEEAVAAAAVRGARLDRVAILGAMDALPATMRSSMQRDAEAGRPLELDAIGGPVLRASADGGRPAPVTARLVDRLRATHT